MRRLFRFLARPIVFSTLGLLILLAVLYVVCDLLLLDDRRWLIELVVGGPLSVSLVIYWLRRYWQDRQLARGGLARPAAAASGPATGTAPQAVVEDFERSLRQLNQVCRDSGLADGTKRLPWILLLGQPAAGKSTALLR